MRSWAQPTADEISRVQALAARFENRAYFFDRLENPLWVAPLAAAGVFADPPPPEPAEEPGYVRFPPWPEGRYLARVASSAADPVAAVLQGIPRSENPTVTRHLLEALLALPEPQFRVVSDGLPVWLEGPFVEHFADEAAAAIARLFQLGDVDRGLAAAATLLTVQPDPRLAEKAASADLPFRPHPEAAARLSEWHYERAIEQLLGVVTDESGIRGVQFFGSLLDDALRMSSWDDEAPDDSSYIWRPAVEDHAQNSDYGIGNVLVSATRDSALRLAGRSEDDLVSVVRELEPRSLMHKRIALHVLASNQGAPALVDERVADHALFDEHRARHEYATLLRRRFGDASSASRALFLSWINEGPDLGEYRRSREQFDGAPPSGEDVERYARAWRRDWLSFVADHLDGSDAEHYQDLVADLGAPEHPDFLSWSSSWSGPESPLSRDELLSRGAGEVVELLRSWRPADEAGWHFGPSREGLGRVFAEVVKQRSAEYAAIADRVTDVDPTYVRNFLSGLESALQAGDAFQWEEPLALADFVATQPFESDEDVPDRDRDPGWRWCRRAVASLLRTGFADRANRIPFRLRDVAWRIINRLTDDPNPSPEHEQRYGGDNMDPLTLSINTNRGTAMHAVIDYALWARRELEAAGEDVSVGFDAMPEVRPILENHLELSTDPSLAIRAVYGRWLPWLLLVDAKWVEEHLAALFPADEELVRYRQVVWGTYIYWCSPYDSVFRALRSEYDAAVRRVPSSEEAGNFGRESADAKLGEHLVTLFWRGVVDTTIVDEFFNRADDELASDVMEYVGHALRNTAGEVADSVRNRIQELWDRRLSVGAMAPEAHKAELRAFGMSFASSKLDQAWALSALERTVALTGAPRVGHWVVERLVAISESDPAAATRVLAAMLNHPENDWDYIGWREEARAIVSAAAGSDDPVVSESCAAVIDYYVKRGELDFRDLLRGENR